MNRRLPYKHWGLVAVRAVLGLLFLVSGVGKMINSSDARYLVELMATEYYWLIEYTWEIVIALSIIELLLGLLLLFNRLLRAALIGSILLFMLFIGVLGYFYLQGMNVQSCGCFGAFGFASGIEFTLIRNIALTLIAFTGLWLKSKLKRPW